MTGEELIVHQFMVALLSPPHEPRFAPKKISEAYLVDDGRKISSLYGVIGAGYLVKVSNGAVTELYYQRHPIKPEASFVAVDTATLAPLSYYVENGPTESKHDYASGELLQINHYVQGFADLPSDFQQALSSFPHKDRIFMYAEKPYGRLIEVRAEL